MCLGIGIGLGLGRCQSDYFLEGLDWILKLCSSLVDWWASEYSKQVICVEFCKRKHNHCIVKICYIGVLVVVVVVIVIVVVGFVVCWLDI